MPLAASRARRLPPGTAPASELLGTFAQQIGGLLDDPAAVIGGLCLPDLEAGLRGGQRRIEVLGGGMGQVGEGLLRRGIEHVLAATAITVVPLAVDVEPELRIRGV